ncbi:uncharacterized protein LOC132552614, partial [Ylistrum balloti]|uniref:uncharacterized protein LOC132552614 n=1 Tax=Ylistrum balloti TaxID=509963 RepID=UPI002905D318
TYDIVASSGGMGQSHIPAGALWEMLRITRKGGFIILVMREEYLRHPVYDDTYDIVASSRGIGQGHIPAGALWEMLRITRKGGFIILVMREEYLRHPEYDGILEVLMENMEETGKWKTIKKRIIQKYFAEKEGVVFVFEQA